MSDRFKWELVLGAAAFTAVGLAAGWHFNAPADAHAEDVKEDEQKAVVLTDVTLRNLGVTLGQAKLQDYQRSIAIAAIVEAPPRSDLSVFAPIGGRVLSINVEQGQFAAPGKSIVTIVRDPLPRPELILTANILKPAQEQLHETVVELRRSASELHIVETELARIERFTEKVDGQELPVIPLQRSIDLKYQRTRAEASQSEARLELLKHGFSSEQVARVAEGGGLPALDEGSWKRALARNGLWTESAERLHSALPESIRALPWVTATVGELAATGLATEELTRWVTAEAAACEHFLDIGVLLLRGHTLADLERLFDLGAFEPIVNVVAPAAASADGAWDVRSILVKPGSLVAAGAPLVDLSNPETLYLRAEPIGGEVAALLAAATDKSLFTAGPLVAGAGPLLQDLAISFVTSSDDNMGTAAFIQVANSLLSSGDGARTWSLRKGLRYLLNVPQETLHGVFVLSPDAIAEIGPETVVFLRNGSTFQSVPVAIAYRDDKVVVLDNGPGMELFDGDLIALSRAFELSFALQAGSAPVDAHAGHNH